MNSRILLSILVMVALAQLAQCVLFFPPRKLVLDHYMNLPMGAYENHAMDCKAYVEHFAQKHEYMRGRPSKDKLYGLIKAIGNVTSDKDKRVLSTLQECYDTLSSPEANIE